MVNCGSLPDLAYARLNPSIYIFKDLCLPKVY